MTINQPMFKTARSHVKRKFAIICGYVGTHFNGSQYQPTLSLNSTVEGSLLYALHKSNLISESNKNDPSKVQLSRSSRTDKKVHSLCSVFSLKLEVEKQLAEKVMSHRGDENDEEFGNEMHHNNHEPLIQMIQEHLPNDIQVFSIQQTNKAFAARYDTTFRAYDYLIPLSALREGEASIANFNQVAKQFIGDQCFINFASLKDFPSEKVTGLMFESVIQLKSKEERVAAYQKLHATKVLSNMSRFIYKFEGVEVIELGGGEKYLLVQIVANSFVYNQIRNMMSSVLCQVNGWLPDDYIKLMLGYPRYCQRPVLAPAEPLIVNSCGGYGATPDPTVRTINLDHPSITNKQNDFRYSKLHPHLHSELTQNDVFSQFETQFNETYEKKFDAEQYRQIQELNHEYAEHVATRISQWKQKEFSIMSEKLAEYQANIRDNIKQKSRDFLPANLVNELSVKYKEKPFSPSVLKVYDYLSKQLSTGAIPFSMDIEPFIEIVERMGGLTQATQYNTDQQKHTNQSNNTKQRNKQK